MPSDRVSQFLSAPRPLLIGGEWVAAQDGGTFDVFDPATGEVLARVASAQAADVDRAVAAARDAFVSPKWKKLVPAQRAKILWRVGDLIDTYAEELAALETLDNGKPLAQARNIDVRSAAEAFRYYAGYCTKLDGKTTPLSIPGLDFHAYTVHEPIGVVGQIVPWNFPLLMAAWKLAPALAAGCTSVLKPAEQTPLSALRLGEILLEAGLPPGVVNIVTGFGETAGAALTAHPGVDKVAFTGSTEVGRIILKAAAGNLKKVSLELGGKSPVIVLGDADPKQAISGAARAIFGNAGQVCTAGSRLFVERPLYDQVVEGVAAFAKKMKVGPGMAADSEMGPLVSTEQVERVTGLIESGRAEGAEVVAGGKRKEGPGYFVEPTVLTGASDKMRVYREEIFGPVLVALPLDDIAQAAALANDTVYGLAASVWTKDLSKAHKLAAEIKAGTLCVNCHNIVDMALPFGGYKQSGWGRESGLPGIEMYTEQKSVIVRL